MYDKELDFEHQQVCAFIKNFIDDNVYNLIIHETWEELKSLYVYK